MLVILTNRNTAMRANKVDVGLGDGTHADLIVSPRQETSKGAHEHHIAVTAGATDAHTNEILLSDEALDESVWEGILVGDGKGGVLGVSVQGHDIGDGLAQFDKGSAISNTGCNLCMGEGVEHT